MKKLTLQFSNGFKTSFSFNGELVALLISEDTESRVAQEIKKIDETNSQQAIYYYVGMWYTDKGMFVEVLSENEAYVINPSSGERYVHTKVDNTGYSVEAGFIKVSRRGEEQYVHGTKIEWPALKGNILG